MLSALIIAPFDYLDVFRRPIRFQRSAGARNAAMERPHEAVARSLGVLVGAAVANVVRDACIVGHPRSDLAALADYAGCAFVEDEELQEGFARALRAARCEQIFVLYGGYAPMAGFIDEVADRMAAAAPRPASMRLEPETFAQRLCPSLAPVIAVSASREACLASKTYELNRLARALGATPMRTRGRRLV